MKIWGTCLILLPFVVVASPIKLYCWIVGDNRGWSVHSETTISNQVDSVNRIYSQVGLQFSIESFSYTNSTHLSEVVYSNPAHRAEICGLTNGTDGLEAYFVNSIIGIAAAFWMRSGIVIGGTRNDTMLAHEIGHACGLSDIYDSYSRETDLVVTGMPQKVYFTHDWGWYPENVTQAQLVQRQLMYGYNTDSTHKGDISRGDVYGLWYRFVPGTTNKVWQLGLAPVGFKLHGNRHPVSE